MVPWVRGPAGKPGELGSIPETDRVEGEDQLLQVVLCLPTLAQ